MYDVIIVWAWRAGLYVAINAKKEYKKLILEKNSKPWIKVLLSWWERANLSNINIEPLRDYFGQNKKSLLSIFARYNNYDVIEFFEKNGITISQEDRWRLILSSWNSRELLDFLLKKIFENNTILKTDSQVLDISKKDDIFIVKTNLLDYKTKKVVLSCWWTSFSQVWTTWDWYIMCNNLWINVISPHRWLCGLVTKKDLSTISWVSCIVDLSLYDWNKFIYNEKWPLLFTHFWISWPIVFNTAVALWEYINKLQISVDNQNEFIKNNILVSIKFELSLTSKSIIKFFELSQDYLEISLELQDYRSWKEAKVTWWWVDIDELDKNLQSKNIPWLYFCWEILDITGKTWGFNLQFAWSSWYIVGTNL